MKIDFFVEKLDDLRESFYGQIFNILMSALCTVEFAEEP